MKKLSALVLFTGLLLALGSTASYAGGTACFDWSCNHSTGTCTFDASCSTASPYIVTYVFVYGDGSSAGPNGSPTGFSHTYASGSSDAMVTLTISFFSDPAYDSATCDIIHHSVPVGPQVSSGRCQ